MKWAKWRNMLNEFCTYEPIVCQKRAQTESIIKKNLMTEIEAFLILKFPFKKLRK